MGKANEINNFKFPKLNHASMFSKKVCVQVFSVFISSLHLDLKCVEDNNSKNKIM